MTKREKVINDPITYALRVSQRLQRTGPPFASQVLPRERLRAWRAANPDKVREARDRANVVRAAAYAAPPGSVCGVCGTDSNVRLDRKRAGTLCPDCGSAVRYVETTERAATYATEITAYRAGTVLRMLA